MKRLLLTSLIGFLLFTIDASAQEPENKTVIVPDSTKQMYQVEAACGECQFKMKGNSCDLAIRLNGVPYFVDGTRIDDHGDAHAKNGLCNAIRRAQVQGEIKEGRFVATYFKLLEE